jgi:hypothetical protein
MPSCANFMGLCLLDIIVIEAQKDDELSESFKQALDFAVKINGKYTKFQLSNILHDYPQMGKT